MNEITAAADLQPHATSMPVPQGNQLLSVISRAIFDPAVPMDRIEWLYARQREMEREQAERVFNAAMSLAQGAMGTVRKDAKNDHTKSRYATYAAIDDAIRPAYTSNGIVISYNQGKSDDPELMRIEAIITHSGGHKEIRHVDLPFDGKGAKGNDVMTGTHARGSAMSYGQRYLLKMIFNIATSDDNDDGNAAAGVGGGTITGDQVDTLRAMIDDIELPIDKFCEYMKVDGVMKILKKDYDKAVFVIGQAAGQKKQRSVK